MADVASTLVLQAEVSHRLRREGIRSEDENQCNDEQMMVYGDDKSIILVYLYLLIMPMMGLRSPNA